MFLGVTIKECKSLLTSVVDDGTLEYYKTALAAHLERLYLSPLWHSLHFCPDTKSMRCNVKRTVFFCGKKTEDISTVDFTYNDNDRNNCFYLQIDL